MAGNESSSSHISCASLIDYLQSLRACLPLQEIFLNQQSPSSHSVTDGALLEDNIKSVKLGIQYLNLYLDISDDSDLNWQIRHLLDDVRVEFRDKPTKLTLSDLNSAYANLREKMNNVPITPAATMNLYEHHGWELIIDHLRCKICSYLLSGCVGRFAPLTKEIEDLKEELQVMQHLLTHQGAQALHIPHDKKRELLNPVFSFISEAGYLLYFCLVDRMDEEVALAMKHRLSDLLKKTKAKDIYDVFLRASRSFGSTSSYPRIDPIGFLENFLGHVKQLMKWRPKSVEPIPLESEIRLLYKELYQEVYSLRNSLIETKGRFKKHEELEGLWSEFVSLAYEAEYVIDYYPVQKVNCHIVQEALSKIIEHTKLIKLDVTRISAHGHENNNNQLAHHCVAEAFEDESSGASDMETAEIMGFEEKAEKIKEYLIRGPDRQDVLLIAGMPGLGKTTLAKKIYEDSSIVEFFDVRAWCSISQTYRKGEVLRKLLRDVLKTNEEIDKLNDVEEIDKFSGDEEVNNLNEEMDKLNDVEEIDMLSDAEEMDKLNRDEANELNEEINELNSDEKGNKWSNVDLVDQEANDEDLAAELYRSLKGHRYLIIIDDLWDIGVWNDLKRSLPDDGLHSRIVITSRVWSLGSQIKKCTTRTLGRFSDDLSWELFKKKVFEKERFSHEFEEVGKQIVKSCKGLPLTIVMIAGIVANVERSVDKWKEFAANLRSHIFGRHSENSCKALIELSYNYLPDHLKSCFLFFAAFPEDAEVPLWRLKALWIAEGFIRDTAGKNKLEDVAEEYFMDLYDRSLVIATRGRSVGGISAYRIHDLLHEFCLQKTKEENFLQVIYVKPWSIAPREAYDQRRLRVEMDENEPLGSIYSREKTSVFHVRSLINTERRIVTLTSNMRFISTHFKLLRVLDLAFRYISLSDSNVELLHHLRYLAITTDFIPPSIAKLRYLQYLLVYISKKSGVSVIPDSVWKMVNLRHVRIDHHESIYLVNKSLSGEELDLVMVKLTANNKYSILDNLRVLSKPCFSSKEDVESLLRRAPYLRKLSCVFLECWETSGSCYEFPVLDFLRQLVSLKVSFQDPGFRSGTMNWKFFPPNLRKLTFSECIPHWEDIARIRRNVQVLKLDGTHCDEDWEVNDEDFPNLKYLRLSNLSLRQWIASSEDSFPKLEKLVIINCEKLEEIPLCFGGMPTLRFIGIASCKPSVEDSAQQIQEEQQNDLMNEEFKLIIVKK